MPVKAVFPNGCCVKPVLALRFLLMIATFSATAPHFTDESNVKNILTQITINLIMATGMTFVILIGGIDLSVGSVMALCAMVAGLVLKSESLPVPVAIAAAALTSVVVGMICGFINGFVSSFWSVPSFIVTLGMLNIARGAALEVTDARTLFEFPNIFNDFGTATLLRIPAIFLVALALVLLGWAVLTRTVFGRLIYSIGNNEEAVRLSGHDTFIFKVAAFVIFRSHCRHWRHHLYGSTYDREPNSRDRIRVERNCSGHYRRHKLERWSWFTDRDVSSRRLPDWGPCGRPNLDRYWRFRPADDHWRRYYPRQ